MESNFISDYLHYSSGNMVPRRFHLWSAASILAAAAGLRFYVDYEYFRINPPLWVTLVGRQGLRKSTAKDLAKELFVEALPDYPLGSSVESREAFVKRLAGDDWLRVYLDQTGASIEWKPVVLFINELKNFLSINPGLMIDTLTDLYSNKPYDASTIKHGLQMVYNPCINILACETPRWIIDKLKLNIISGGFSRRMLFVYETQRPARITFPKIPEGGMEARERCKKHLEKLTTMSGQFQWTPDGRAFFDKWYKGLHTPDDEVLEGFYENKDVLSVKMTMLLCLAEWNPQLVLTKEKLQLGIAFLESIEDNLPKLTVAAGRSETAIPQLRVTEILQSHGGLLPEKALMRECQKDFKNATELWSAMRFMVENEIVIKKPLQVPPDKVQKSWILLPETWAAWQKNGEATEKEKEKSPNGQTTT